ncbi:unnamed protein product [Oikopleura dioica]|uniref:Sulfotransferase n=2 Tax=Oikopleura dioica TaxID=34765 RepID=E4YYL2_OIKDI|nr:unnamed protein product [Oikopleura dioica]
MNAADEEKNIEGLIKLDFMKMLDGFPVRESVDEKVIRELQSMSLPSNAVIVAGYPKTGSHFLLQILGQLNFRRLYDIGDGDAKCTSLPLEFQKFAALETMRDAVCAAPKTNFVFNHSHAYPDHLPKNAKVLYISRDIRAVAVSGFHFFGSMEKYKIMFDHYNIKNVDDYAKIVFQGKSSYGNMFRYDALWREAAAASSGRIHCVTFEGLKTELKKNVVEIVDFLGLENVDIDKVVEGSKFKSHDKDFNEAAKITDTDSKSEKIVKRKGETDSWKRELSEVSWKLYAQLFPNRD